VLSTALAVVVGATVGDWISPKPQDGGRARVRGDRRVGPDDLTDLLALTVSTGHGAAATTRSATLPTKSFASPVRPWVRSR